MKSKKRLLFSLAWGGLGVLLLVAALRSATSRVLASQAEERMAQPELESAAQGAPDWQTVVLDAQNDAPTGTLYLPVVSAWRPTYLYLPFVSGQHPTYVDDFSDPSSGWPTWRKNTGSEKHRGGYMVELGRAQLMAELLGVQDPSTLDPEILAGHPEVFYSVVHDAWDEVFISGPFQVKGDFIYEVKGRYTYVQDWQKGNRYGILISKERVKPSDAHTVHGYTFHVEINPVDDGDSFDKAGWALKRWSRTDWDGEESGGDDNKTIKGPHTSSSIKSKLWDWNTLRLERRGTVLRLYVNGVYLGEEDDGTYTGPMYIGFWCRHTGSGSTELSYDVLFEWDDVYVEY